MKRRYCTVLLVLSAFPWVVVPDASGQAASSPLAEIELPPRHVALGRAASPASLSEGSLDIGDVPDEAAIVLLPEPVGLAFTNREALVTAPASERKLVPVDNASIPSASASPVPRGRATRKARLEKAVSGAASRPPSETRSATPDPSVGGVHVENSAAGTETGLRTAPFHRLYSFDETHPESTPEGQPRE